MNEFSPRGWGVFFNKMLEVISVDVKGIGKVIDLEEKQKRREDYSIYKSWPFRKIG